MRISDWSSDVCSSDLLNALAADIVQLLAPPAEVVVTVEGPLPTVFGERTRLQQVFQNLISNAIKHRDKPACHRSEERRVGKECVSKCRSRWSPAHKKKKELVTSQRQSRAKRK